MIVTDTPLEEHDGILVKREDLCSPYPGPAFSKIRGVAAHIASRPEGVIGALDTFHSKAGWAVAYIAKNLGKRSVVFFPVYKKDADQLLLAIRPQQEEAARWGAELRGLPAGRSAVLYHEAKREMDEMFDGYMMPNALKLDESVAETAAEVRRTPLPYSLMDGTVVISVSSGTIAAGVLRGLSQVGIPANIVLHLGYSRPELAVRRYVEAKAGIISLHQFRSVRIVDEGYRYKDQAEGIAPFPCNPYYDLKAWRWLMMERGVLAEPIVFWNIGA